MVYGAAGSMIFMFMSVTLAPQAPCKQHREALVDAAHIVDLYHS